jgi:hypothetical protein
VRSVYTVRGVCPAESELVDMLAVFSFDERNTLDDFGLPTVCFSKGESGLVGAFQGGRIEMIDLDVLPLGSKAIHLIMSLRRKRRVHPSESLVCALKGGVISMHMEVRTKTNLSVSYKR